MLRHICVIFLEGLSLHHLPVLQSGIQGQKRTSGRLYLDNRGSKRFLKPAKRFANMCISKMEKCTCLEFGAIKCILKMRVAQECIACGDFSPIRALQLAGVHGGPKASRAAQIEPLVESFENIHF